MEISEVKNAVKYGDFILRQDSPNKIDIKWLPNITKEMLKDETPRVYLFVQDGRIKKIGGSAGLGGIKATISFYITGMQGSPGSSRFITHLLIANALEKGAKMELYMITSPKVPAVVNGLFSSKKMEIASFKEMERFCNEEYYEKEKKYPDWDFQENNEDYPSELAQLHNKYHQERLKKKQEQAKLSVGKK